MSRNSARRRPSRSAGDRSTDAATKRPSGAGQAGADTGSQRALPDAPGAGPLRPGRLDLLAATSLGLLALSLLAYRLGAPGRYVFDEVYHARTAADRAAGASGTFSSRTVSPVTGMRHTWNHPPAGLLPISAGVALLGDGPLGWRLPGALFGAAGVALCYMLALLLSGSRPAALLGSLFLLGSGLYYVQSRVAMLDVFLLVWTSAALLALHAYLRAPAHRARGPLLILGACLGLAVSTKWSAASAALAALVVLWRWRRLHVRGRGWRLKAHEREGLRRHAVWAPVALLLLPAGLYLACYAQYFLQ